MIAREKLLPKTSILTASGLVFDYADPDPTSIRITDVALALAKTCRYGGHVPGTAFLSVAEHSVIAVQVLDALTPRGFEDPQLRWAVLCHDFAEAFTGDIPGPMKLALGPSWHEFEGRIEDLVCARFSVRPDLFHSGERKIADRVAYELERRQIFGWQDVEPPEPLRTKPIDHWSRPPRDAYYLLLEWIMLLAPEIGRQDLAQEAQEAFRRDL